MSPQLFVRNNDLKRLRHEDGYHVEVRGSSLVMHGVPYFNPSGKVARGILISPLNLAGETTLQPDNHQIYFVGEMPCQQNGSPLGLGNNQTGSYPTEAGLTAQFHFSNKPQNGQYTDYHHKMTTYAELISGPVQAVHPEVTARVNRPLEDEETSIFKYPETASGRVGIGGLTDLLSNERVGIVGLGGTGSYVLDLIAKTPVPLIRLIDGDDFLNHNAFRAPGAASLEELSAQPKKVEYLCGIYSKMRHGIETVSLALDETNLHHLDSLTFVFLCIDGGKAKAAIIRKLEEMGISFIDVGMSVNLGDTGLGGMMQATLSTPDNRTTMHAKVSMVDDGENLYSSNIQIAELNNMNAIQAVIMWKQLRGFYRDYEHKAHVSYTTDTDLWEGNK